MQGISQVNLNDEGETEGRPAIILLGVIITHSALRISGDYLGKRPSVGFCLPSLNLNSIRLEQLQGILVIIRS